MELVDYHQTQLVDAIFLGLHVLDQTDGFFYRHNVQGRLAVDELGYLLETRQRAQTTASGQ